MAFPKFFDAQRTTIEFGKTHKYAIYALEQGLGKSLVSIATAIETNSKALFVVPSYLMLKMESEINKFYPGKSISLLKNDREFYKLWDTDFAIISYHFLDKADCLFEWADMVIFDECFHGDTLVDTASGTKKISEILVGDLVVNCLGLSKVKSVSKKNVEKIIKLKFNGSEILCSHNHPFLTSRGWVKAIELLQGDLLVRNTEAMRVVRECSYSEEDKILREILLSEMEDVSARDKEKSALCGNIQKDFYESYRPEKTSNIYNDDREKSYGVPRDQREGEKYAEAYGTQAKGSRREWESSDSSRVYTDGSLFRVEVESCYKSGEIEGGISDLLQSRPSLCRYKTSYRSGRKLSRVSESENGGPKENGNATYIRVESAESIEQEDIAGAGNSYFYDLGVEGHPSFTVNGAVVHNCQYLKNSKAKRTEAAHRLIYENSIKRCLFLSGTPIENRVYEFYSLIAMCNYDPEIEESKFLKEFPSYVDFANHFSYLKEFDMWKGSRKVKVQSWEGYKNVEELKEYLKPHYIRFKIDDVLELPPSIDIEVPVSYEDNPELLKCFEQFGSSGDMSGVSSDVKSKAAISKAPFTAEYVSGLLDQCLQVVVYSDHPAAAEAIAKKLGVKHIDGSTPMHTRQQMADNFQAKRTKVIVATAGSFSTGIDLFSAQDMVINDLPWKPSAEDQMRSRIRRNGQTGKCRYHYIYGTIQDKKIREKLDDKRKTLQAVV